ncbi:hypothetical protein AYI68_g6975, partial [Smittium mucronatum]
MERFDQKAFKTILPADTPAEEARAAPIVRAFGIEVFGGRPIRPDNV